MRIRPGALGPLLGTVLAAGACAPATDRAGDGDAEADPRTLAARLARDFLERRPAEALPAAIDLAAAYDVQGHYVEHLVPRLGPVAGYKAALTSPALQARFGLEAPVHGTLLAGMLRPDGFRLGPSAATRPFLEVDLLVRVASTTINDAATPREALAALAAVHPFIEVGDLIYGAQSTPRAAEVVAVSAGARLGVVGPAIPLAANDAWLARLRGFEAELLDGDGTVRARGSAREALGDPLERVLWLRDALRARGTPLEPGQVLSLGAITAPVPLVEGLPFPGPPLRGGTVRARYLRLSPDGPVEVTLALAPDE